MAREGKTTERWPVATRSEIGPGEHKIVSVKRHSVGVYNVNGEYHAILNVCPHELAPVCRGPVGGTTLPSRPGSFEWGREGEILSCPWHGWEFDLLTGASVADPKVRVRRYEVEIEGDTIYVVL